MARIRIRLLITPVSPGCAGQVTAELHTDGDSPRLLYAWPTARPRI